MAGHVKTKFHSMFGNIKKILHKLWVPDYLAVTTLEPENSSLRKIHISKTMIDDFINIAKPNTEKKLHTGAALLAIAARDVYYVIALYIPLQTSMKDTFEVFREVRMENYCKKYGVVPIGWIHLHPAEQCYLTDIELHNLFRYQEQVREFIAIILAPNSIFKKYGVFRIRDPEGMEVIRECKEIRPCCDHKHKNPETGGPIYHECSNNVILDSKIKYDIEDMHFNPCRKAYRSYKLDRTSSQVDGIIFLHSGCRW
ncbi:hypothetical protein ZOSMA_80G00500 [Zostera marina]|uniref:MPN domain-containing protein n=1 Tax=Zostera marina TaxID=29655 RepID=A0A0K9NPE0_ZOSMR|nr:hypothetical protein ZOSMA_80G00500 [Zostera marina]